VNTPSTYLTVGLSVTDPQAHHSIGTHADRVTMLIYCAETSGNVSMSLPPALALTIGEALVASATKALAASGQEAA
jgi:hypothetical protein